MHELSIAQRIVEMVEEQIHHHNAPTVTLIELDIGKLAGVSYPAIEFAWPEATRNTLLEGAMLKINKPRGLAVCNQCQHEFEIERIFDVCPKCQSVDTEVIGGKELLLRKIELSTQ